MKQPVPFGFFLLGFLSLGFGLAMAALVLSLAGDGAGWEMMLARGAGSVLAALGLVTTEALWRARPWAWRVSATLAATWVVTVLLMEIVLSDMAERAVTTLIPSLVLLIPTLAYIYQRTRQLWPAQVPVARPGRP